MKDIITNVLADASLRDINAVEGIAMQQAVAIPWGD